MPLPPLAVPDAQGRPGIRRPGRPLVAVLNGPNINLLGLREPHLPGAEPGIEPGAEYVPATMDDVEQLCAETAEGLDLAIDFRQTNSEGELVSWVQECRGRAQGIVINPAGYTTTSVALMDALLAIGLPAIEVHVTNIHAREGFRRRSLVSRAVVGVISGLGVRSYALALRAMADLLDEPQAGPQAGLQGDFRGGAAYGTAYGARGLAR